MQFSDVYPSGQRFGCLDFIGIRRLQKYCKINQVSGQFEQIKSDIAKSVNAVRDEVEGLKNSSLEVESHFKEMKITFHDFQSAVQEIKKCTNKITSIAEQTNIL